MTASGLSLAELAELNRAAIKVSRAVYADTERSMEQLQSHVRFLASRIDYHEAAQQRIARILADFSAAPISMGSIQPILDLAAELNKELR